MATVDHVVQREILSKVRFKPDGARYSQLKVKDIENDLFNYHLQQLVKKGLLRKVAGRYLLTKSGKSTVTNIDEEDLKNPPVFKVSVYMVLQDRNKVLLYQRKKHPQYNYVGFPSGKIRYGENLLGTATRELNEETGLKAKFKLVGNIRQIRKNSMRQIIEDGVFYICHSDKFSGKLVPKGKEGIFFWKDRSEVGKIKKLFKPSVELVLKALKNKKCKTFVYELEPDEEDY
jgi:ADP-ribose pyrophosphatase YjhB (NUDIX family)